MTTKNQSKNQNDATLAERASGLVQGGVDAVKNNPGTTAAVIGGVAAAAAAYVNRDKLAETASSLREKASASSSKSDTTKA